MEAAGSDQNISRNAFKDLNSLFIEAKSKIDDIMIMVREAKVEVPLNKVKIIRIKQPEKLREKIYQVN
jgi:hypothetical protein